MKAFRNSNQRRLSRASQGHQRSQIPQESVNDQPIPVEEPMGHVHGAYRHWIWLGLHRHSDS